VLSEVGTMPLFFHKLALITLTFVRALIFFSAYNFFSFSREYIWRVDVFNGVLIYIPDTVY
jgi:hypothetical protein